MAKNLRCDIELAKSARGNGAVLYSGRIPQADQQDIIDAEGGVANGTFVELGDLEAGQREIHVAVKPTGSKPTYIVMRGEVNPAQYTKSDAEFGKFRTKADHALTCILLQNGDYIGLSEDFFPALPAVGDVYNLDANFIAGTQLVAGAVAAGTFSLKVVEVQASSLINYIVGDGSGAMAQPYKMISLEVIC